MRHSVVICQVIEGLAFLHNDARLMHGNVCPESIVFNRSGAWKLAGFDFSISGTVSSEHSKVSVAVWHYYCFIGSCSSLWSS